MSLLEHHDTHGAVESLVREADIEVIPLRGVDEKLTVVPAGTTLTITCSAKFGLERTLAYTALAVKAGYRVVPHLAARQVADVAALLLHLAQRYHRPPLVSSVPCHTIRNAR